MMATPGNPGEFWVACEDQKRREHSWNLDVYIFMIRYIYHYLPHFTFSHAISKNAPLLGLPGPSNGATPFLSVNKDTGLMGVSCVRYGSNKNRWVLVQSITLHFYALPFVNHQMQNNVRQDFPPAAFAGCALISNKKSRTSQVNVSY